MDSILQSIKKLIGPSTLYDHFDADLIIHINTVFTILNQLGVGPSAGFVISGDTETWDQFLPAGEQLEMVKSYMFLRVKMLFDPPLSSGTCEVYNRQITEFEWRLNVAVDPKLQGE